MNEPPIRLRFVHLILILAAVAALDYGVVGVCVLLEHWR